MPYTQATMSDTPDIETLARRFVDLWQDQLTAMTADPDAAQTLSRMMSMSGDAGAAFADAVASGFGTKETQDKNHADPGETEKSGQPVGATPPSPASLSGSEHMDELLRRLGDIEKRLTLLEGGTAGKSRKAKAGPKKR